MRVRGSASRSALSITRRLLDTLAVAAISSVPASSAHADTESWNWVEYRVPVSAPQDGLPGLQVRLMSDVRFNGRNGGLDLMFFRAGPLIQLADWVSLAGHFVVIADRLNDGTHANVYRPELDLNFHFKLGDFSFLDRNRVEVRVGDLPTLARYRNLFRVHYQPKGEPWMILLWDEVLFSNTNGPLQENRFVAGVGLDTPAVRFELAHMLRTRTPLDTAVNDNIAVFYVFIKAPKLGLDAPSAPAPDPIPAPPGN